MAGESFFGQDPTHEDQQSGIPADLIPYLEAADEVEDTEAGEGTDPEVEESEREAALRALVEHSLLLGPDPSILAEIEGEVDEEFADDAAEANDERASHEAVLAKAQDDVALDARVQEIYQSIVARAPEHDIDPTLDRVKLALDILGDPQNFYPSIHITGTNGKTSTSRMIDSLLTAFGMKTGRFTSPHLLDVRERISLEGHPITREGFVRAWEDIEPYVGMVDERSSQEGGPRLSFFEVFTIMAYAAFADYPVDAAVVEVGMGGRWDATNVIDAGVAVITPIALDHTKWLGSTIEEIAREKAGIIKPGQVVVKRKSSTSSSSRRAPSTQSPASRAATSRSWIVRWGSAARWLRSARLPRSTRMCSSRCSASIRRTTRRRRSWPSRPSWGAAAWTVASSSRAS